MEQVSLRARTGRQTGSRASRRLRRQGQVPAVVYGRELEPIHIAVDERELYGVLHTDFGVNALINLEIEGADDILTLARVIERHPFRPEYRHIDFVKVSLTEKVTAEISVHFEGEPVGVEEGGVFSPARTTVVIEALVTDIPGYVELDVSAVEIGESLRISDLPAVEGVEYLEDPEAVVMSVTLPAAEEPEPEPEEGLEIEGVAAAEGEEPEPEEGAAPEAGEEAESESSDED
jgi:large subunit ribosomal protein L25